MLIKITFTIFFNSNVINTPFQCYFSILQPRNKLLFDQHTNTICWMVYLMSLDLQLAVGGNKYGPKCIG